MDTLSFELFILWGLRFFFYGCFFFVVCCLILLRSKREIRGGRDTERYGDLDQIVLFILSW